MMAKHELIEDQSLFVTVARSILPRRVVWQTEHLVARAVLEDPTYRAVVRAASDADLSDRDQHYTAEDRWENEGGAPAYA